MPINILMPALSPTMETGTLAKWHIKEGDKVESGDLIAEVETDKATMDVEAVDEGVIAKIIISEASEDVPVNTPIAILLEEDEDASALEGYDPSAASAGLKVGQAASVDDTAGKTKTIANSGSAPSTQPT